MSNFRNYQINYRFFFTNNWLGNHKKKTTKRILEPNAKGIIGRLSNKSLKKTAKKFVKGKFWKKKYSEIFERIVEWNTEERKY